MPDKTEQEIFDYYRSDEFLRKNPGAGAADSPSKVIKLKPLLDRLMQEFDQPKLTLLDAGGGAGYVCHGVAEYLREKHQLTVDKIALDLSQSTLDLHRKTNPDLKQALVGDIQHTPFEERSIDLTLLIDLIEHVPDPDQAATEINRISKYAIYKVPLEDNLYHNLMNLLTRGRTREKLFEDFGHIHALNARTLRHLLKNTGAEILHFSYFNMGEYFLQQPDCPRSRRLRARLSTWLYRLSPALQAKIFHDFALVLVRSSRE